MPDDSSGIYSVPAGTIVTTGDTILPSQHNPWANDSASAISNRFSKDGRAPATGNWNINSFRLTNVGAPIAGGDAANKTYVDGLAGSAVLYTTQTLTAAQQTIARTNVSAALRGQLFGLTLSNNVTDPTNDIDIAVGEAASTETNPVLMTLASTLTKRLDAAWAVGSGNGGLDTGSIANTTYYVWLIQRSDTGVVDALFSTSATSPTMPTNYDRKCRIGSFARVSAVNNAPRSLANDATDWVAYTPTFTGFGTVSSVFFYSRRVGDSLEVRGTFVAGTTTATEARITLGFNGTNANVTSSGSAKLPARSVCGSVAFNLNTASQPTLLIDGSIGHLLLGVQSSSTGGYNAANANAIATSGTAISVFGSVPISGW